MKINIITLGCSKNIVDSEHIAGHLRKAGFKLFFDRSRNDCDIVIVNTCGFIGDAKEVSINVLLEQIAIKKRSRSPRRLIAVGCLIQRYEKELRQELPEIDAFYGVHQWGELVRSLQAEYHDILESERMQSTPQHYAYLKISEGCNRTCSYCAIPLIRGKHVSRPIELLERLATESGAQWIRLHYTYPTSFPFDAIEVMRRHKNICNYIDIPLQHINTRILNSMQRGIDREGTLSLLDSFRQQLPDVAIRTTLIVGYPGETLEEFEELKEFVRQARFDRMGCFAYSPEEGTAAYTLTDDVPEEEKERRVSELMAIQEQISLEKNQERIGKTYRVLIDRIDNDYIVGRTEYDSPEVDDEVLIPHHSPFTSPLSPSPGTFVDVVITDALENDLIARLVEK